MLPYEKIKEKKAMGGTELRDVNALTDGLTEIANDGDLPFAEKLKEYVEAINYIKMRSNQTKNPRVVEKVKKSLEVMKDFKEFLESGEKDTVYQQILDAGKKLNCLTEDELDNGLTRISSFLGLDIDLLAIEKIQKEFDEKKAELIDPNPDAPVTEAKHFDLKVKIGNTFANEKQPAHKSVTNLLDVMKDAEFSLSNQVEKIEKQERLNPKFYSDAQKEKNEEIKQLYKDVKKYKKAIEDLQKVGAPAYMNHNITENDKKNALETLSGFQNFLEEGMTQTNLSVILKEAGKANEKRNANRTKDHFYKGLEALNNTLHLGFDGPKAENVKKEYVEKREKEAAEKKKIEDAKRDVRDADKVIDAYKRQLDKNPASIGDKKEFLTKIMMARLLVNSGRDQISTLKKPVVRFELENKVKDMLERPGHFKDFMELLDKNPKMMDKAMKAAGTGHGGGLDDMFRGYLKTRPAGELHTDPMLERYMPTAKERIEMLQNQAKEMVKKDPMANIDKQVIEIVAIRNAVQAHRDKKSSLEVKLPTREDWDLAGQVQALNESNEMKFAIANHDAQKLIGKGHGGAMVDLLRKGAYEDKEPSDFNLGDRILSEGTFAGRQIRNQRKALELQEKLEKLSQKPNENEEAIFETMKESRELIAESIALINYMEQKDIKEQKQFENIPWNSVKKMQAQVLASSNTDSALYPKSKYDVKDVTNRLSQLGNAESAEKFYSAVKTDVTIVLKKEFRENQQARKEYEAYKAGKQGKGEIQEKDFEKMHEQMDEMFNQINNMEPQKPPVKQQVGKTF